MTASMRDGALPAARPRALRRVRGGGLPGAVAAEWTKLRSLGSTWMLLLAAVVTMAAGTTLLGLATHAEQGADAAARVSDPATPVAMYPVVFVTAALAASSVTGEYVTGTIVTTLQCVPDRTRLMLAKCIAVAVVVLAIGCVLGALGILAGALAFETTGFDRVRALDRTVAIAVHPTLTSLLALGLAALTRNATATLVTMFVLLILAPVTLSATGAAAAHDVAQALPQAAGARFTANTPAPYGRGPALLILAMWAAAAGIATATLRRRDA
ncbi:ABC transporter permease [Embleya sp. NPDC056575]|uniref:ABC transporter permease n=1 Tax=unclassified Embleya TaxID=2699296 RepID=UPI00367AADA7